jgi:uncharacterized protein (DUF111 family)
MAGHRPEDLPDVMDEMTDALGLPDLKGKIRVIPKEVSNIGGYGLSLDLPRERVHRTLREIAPFFRGSAFSPAAKELALSAFEILAEAEGKVHGIPASDVHFHEVGALDSILDTGLASAFFAEIDPDLFVCGPLPICDGAIECAHGVLPSPAPAVSHLLEGVTVRGFPSEGETVTPTGIALLKAFGAKFGDWPEMVVDAQALVYGTKTFPGVPNGALFARGRAKAAPNPL